MSGRHRRPKRITVGPSWRSGVRTLLPGSMANLAVQGLLAVLGLFTGMVTARVLGPAKRGELSFVVLVPMMLTVLGSLGTENGVYYLWHQKHGMCRQELLGACVAVASVSGAFFGAVGYVVVSWIEPQTGLLLRLLVAVSMPLAIANAILTMALMANGNMARYNASRLAGPAVFTFSVATLWIAGRLGVSTAFLAWFGSMIVTVLTDIAMISGLGHSRPRWDVQVARRSVAYGLRSYVGSVSQYGTLRFDQTMVATLAGNGALGLYYAAVSVGETLLYLASNLGAAMLAQYAGRSRGEKRHLTVVAIAAVGGGTTIAATPLIFFGHTVITLLFGRAYLPGLTSLRILLPGLIALGVAQVMSGYFIAIGEAKVFARAALASLIVTVTGDVVLIPMFQAVGAAVVSSLAYMIMALWMGLAFRADSRTSFAPLTIGEHREGVPA